MKEGLANENTQLKIWSNTQGTNEDCTLAIPGVSLSKLQLQSMVDFIVSVGISDM